MFRRLTGSPRVRPLRERARRLWNVARFGTGAPRPNERIWIDPAAVRVAIGGLPVRSGYVVRRWPPVDPVPLDEHPHVRFALARWRDGVPWAETGAFDYMLDRIARHGRQDGCSSLEDVERRYARLDELFETARREGRLRTRPELDPEARDEDGGILVHLGPAGEPAIGDGGKHRLTVARVLGIPLVPARIGYVHRDAIPLLPALRSPSPEPAARESA